MHPDVAHRVQRACGSTVVGAVGVGGGCISDARKLDLEDGRAVFIKTNATAPADMFPSEAQGLAAMAAVEGAPPVPGVFLADPDLLVLEYFPPGRLDGQGWAQLGRSLAQMHRHGRPDPLGHGFDGDNYIGATPQRNPWCEDGVTFFAEHRIGFQVRLAVDRGLLSPHHLRQAEALMARLPEFFPADEPPALLHGDLWSGNVLARADGVGCIVDPAVHYGFREADLAMSRLFGSFSSAFYDGYGETWPLASGAPERVPLFNLYHLLNHLNLFGRSYLGQCEDLLRRYGSG